MISDELRKKIEKNLKNNTDLTNYDIYFKETYKMVDNGYNIIVLHPSDPRVPSMTFSMDDGKFVGLEDWDYVRENGELL